MIIKIAELQGAALDWAVIRCRCPIGAEYWLEKHMDNCMYNSDRPLEKPSTDWAQGGLIIERENISITRNWLSGEEGHQWTALCSGLNYWQDIKAYGSTPLIAAMRCYVASKNNRLGNDIDVPDELVNPT